MLCCLHLLITFAMPAMSEERSVTLESSEYPPFYGKELLNQGVITEIVVKAFKKVEYKADVQFRPFARALSDGKDGKIDGVIALWHTHEREQWFAFSDPLPANQIGFYKRKDKTIRYKTLSDLAPYRIGVVTGYAVPPRFKEANLKTEDVSEDYKNLLKLQGNRFELTLIDKWVAQYLIRNRYPHLEQELEWMEPPLEIKPQYLAFSIKSQGYKQRLNDFNEGLQQLKKTGELEAILTKHGFSE
ncbi:hypothetical protein BTA51_26280 [Hahella sp. CCB-MM4]|nr:hypothetical protein BTA51_26280 [Hahella sp. CCB-MM4]